MRPACCRHLTTLSLLALIGCSGYAPSAVQTGQSQDEVVRLMGPPTGRYGLPQGGSRLEYARGPAGRETYMIDLDAQGRVLGWQQVLTEVNLQALPIGIDRDELLRRIGRPGSVWPIPRQHLQVWNYRYPTHDCLWFQVSVSNAGQVLEASPGIDPACDRPNRAP
jgi:hypothetical protein